MGPGNGTGVSEFILLGLSSRPATRRLLFPVFLAAYLVTLLGNLLITLLIRRDPRLRRAPMYFFLTHLSLADVGFTSTAAPTALGTLASGCQAVPYAACLAQNYAFIVFGVLENFLLAVMAYDRYLAVCRPLRYPALMSRGRRWGLAGAAWLLAQLHALLHTLLLARLPFPDTSQLRHFFCDLRQLLALSSGDTRPNHAAIVTEGSLAVLGPLLLVVGSYGRIVAALARLPTARGWRRALSTCGAHLAVVALFYGTVIGLFFRPAGGYSPWRDMVATLLYSTLTPLVNPFIYSLRNKEMRGALRRALGRGAAPQDA
ncbi:olfactory receptor 1E5-like [Emydura macquarii macquarii]|uniref:olfactory receptor 1E5-like n=1 Tax=Emydura macquarii macquarii TaxID=1129001 RepID=UPI003529D7B8